MAMDPTTACELPNVVDKVVSIVPLFLSLAIVIFAGLQCWISSNKLRLDLFDRRYKVYDAAKKFLNLTFQETNELTDLAEFNIAVADAEFLFESDVLNYLKQLRENAAHLRTTRTLLERPRSLTDDELKKRAKAKEEDINRLISELNEMTKVFSRYLGFAHIARGPRARRR